MTILFNKFHAYVNIDKFIGTFKIYYIKKPSLISKQIHSKNKKIIILMKIFENNLESLLFSHFSILKNKKTICN
jgi:hypothetical protein